jgi:transcriptional regulator with GAF, ATPase, and Fis domain
VIERLGSEKVTTVDVRVIAATNKDLLRAAHQGQFREDLLFRLNVIPISIPPLRERPEDVAPLVQHFVAKQEARLGREVRFDTGALDLLVSYPWPGNVRELANVVERMAILAISPVIGADDVARVLPHNGRLQAESNAEHEWQDTELTSALDQYERILIARALSAARGNVAEAARKLATDRANLYRRMRRLGLEPPRAISE